VRLFAGIPAALIILSGCASFDEDGESDWDRKTSKRICENLTDWVSAGPRLKTGDRKLNLPDAYANAYANDGSGPDEDLIVLTAFAWDFECPDDLTCEDKADVSFKDALRPYAHSLSSSGYYDQMEPCLIGGSVSQDYDRHDKNMTVKGNVSNADVTMNWLSETREAQISVVYK